MPAEVLNARREDPDFAEVMGRARARARGEDYDPDLHHPDRGLVRAGAKLDPENLASLYELIDRWMDRRVEPAPYRPQAAAPQEARPQPVPPRRHLRAL